LNEPTLPCRGLSTCRNLELLGGHAGFSRPDISRSSACSISSEVLFVLRRSAYKSRRSAPRVRNWKSFSSRVRFSGMSCSLRLISHAHGHVCCTLRGPAHWQSSYTAARTLSLWLLASHLHQTECEMAGLRCLFAAQHRASVLELAGCRGGPISLSMNLQNGPPMLRSGLAADLFRSSRFT